jgi:hypothetical protein
MAMFMASSGTLYTVNAIFAEDQKKSPDARNVCQVSLTVLRGYGIIKSASIPVAGALCGFLALRDRFEESSFRELPRRPQRRTVEGNRERRR